MNICLTDKDANVENNIVHINDLHTLENGFFESIDMKNMLDKVQQKERVPVLQMCIQKIEYGGKLFLENLDVISLSDALLKSRISVEDFMNNMRNVGSVDTLHTTLKILRSNNMKIDYFNLNDDKFTYDIVSTRNV